MPRSARFVFALAVLALAAFGAVADRALRAQAERAQEGAARAGQETARLTAQSIRAALAQIEQHVLLGETVPDVAVERLAVAPSTSVASSGSAAYARRPRAELAGLLRSTRVTDNGMPEAVVARLALGKEAPVSTSGEAAAPDVAELLLTGALPVRPEDLPVLARALGAGADARIRPLQQRLRDAPEASGLPGAPDFRRTVDEASVGGWTRADAMRVRYAIPKSALLLAARAPEGTRTSSPDAGGAVAEVPDVAGLAVAVPVRAPEAVRMNALRAALWLALAISGLGLVAVRRALSAEGRANAREKAFLTSVTHELRTPLAAIRLLGERLAEGRGDPREYGALVAEESQRLDALVERVLAATRAGERPSFASVEPGEILRSAVRLIAPRAERRAVIVACDADGPLPAATWDADSVRHALLNLLDNAVKHGREGGRVEASAAVDGNVVSFRVRDDGPGIGRRDRDGLFHRFVRGTTDAPGTGLGLHFVEQVARAHGGHVDLTSEEGRGCTFTLRLPLRPPTIAATDGSPA